MDHAIMASAWTSLLLLVSPLLLALPFYPTCFDFVFIWFRVICLLTLGPRPDWSANSSDAQPQETRYVNPLFNTNLLIRIDPPLSHSLPLSLSHFHTFLSWSHLTIVTTEMLKGSRLQLKCASLSSLRNGGGITFRLCVNLLIFNFNSIILYKLFQWSLRHWSW